MSEVEETQDIEPQSPDTVFSSTLSVETNVISKRISEIPLSYPEDLSAIVTKGMLSPECTLSVRRFHDKALMKV